MKVKNLLDKMSMASNCFVFIHDVNTDKVVRLFYCDLRKNYYHHYGEMKLNSFTIYENNLTIYAE